MPLVAILKKPKGQCTAPEKMLQIHVKIVAVPCCVVELGRLKKEEERRKKKVEIRSVLVCRFRKLGIAVKATVHRKFAS